MYLRGECRETFLASGLFEYQHRVFHTRTAPPTIFGGVLVVFALGEDEMGHQVCAVGDAEFDGSNDRDQLATIAIAKCNEFASSRASYKVNCKLFAVGNEIVWGKEEDVEFQ